MKRKLIVILMIAIVFSILSIRTILKDHSANSFEAYTRGVECKTQCDIKPAPWNE